MTTLADKFTVKVRKNIYSDFTTNFELNPVTGFLAKVTNEEAVKKSIRNLIFTIKSERFQRSNIGSKIRAILFDPIDTTSAELLQTTIKETIQNFEPRALLRDVIVVPDEANNGYSVSIYFEIINIPNQQFDMELTIARVR